MADTDKLAAEMLAGLDGVTPVLDGDMMRYDHGGGRLAILRDGERTLVADFYHEADREHYLRCSPDNIRALLEERSAREATISALEAENKRLREALEPFVAAFEKRRDAHSRRYKDRSLGYANFDKMPDKWPMEKIEFTMRDFRRARDISRNRRETP